MKKKMVKLLSTLVLGVSLTSIPANAMETGWVKHCQISADRYAWEYINPDGTSASGWEYIDGYWYYFDQYDGVCYTGNCYRTADGLLAGDIEHSFYNIDGNVYWFDMDGHLITNSYTRTLRSTYYVDNNGYASLVSM